MTPGDKRSLVLVGTSGSTDYLRDDTQDRRFSVGSVSASSGPIDAEDASALQTYLARTSDNEPCDGVHDEGAPSQYLCTRCFPEGRGDLAEHDDEVVPDEPEEIE